MDADFNNPMPGSNDPRNDAGQTWSSPAPQQTAPYGASSPYERTPYEQYEQTPYSQTASDAGSASRSSQTPQNPYASNPYAAAGQYPLEGAQPQGAAYETPQYETPQYGTPQYGASQQPPQTSPYGQTYASPQYSSQKQQHGQPYGQYPPAGAYYPYYEPPTERWNTLAIVGFVLCFVFVPAALIVSIIALWQINRTHERGKGFAIAGIVISAVCIAILVVVIILAIVAMIWVANSDPSGWSGSYCVGNECSNYGGYGDFEDAALRQIAMIRAMNPFAGLR